MKRIQWLDFGKGFTIFLVLVGHVFKGMQQSGAFEAYHASFQFIIQCFYIFHIPVFFALSGYLFSRSRICRPILSMLSRSPWLFWYPMCSFALPISFSRN